MLLFSPLKMGASSSRTTHFKVYFLKKNMGQVWSPEFKKDMPDLLWYQCWYQWPQCSLEDGESWLVEGSLNYSIVSQLYRFYRKQEKWVEVPYVLLSVSLQDMPDLHAKGTDLDVKPSAPSCPLILPLYPGLPTEQAESHYTLPGGLATVSVEIQKSQLWSRLYI